MTNSWLESPNTTYCLAKIRVWSPTWDGHRATIWIIEPSRPVLNDPSNQCCAKANNHRSSRPLWLWAIAPHQAKTAVSITYQASQEKTNPNFELPPTHSWKLNSPTSMLSSLMNVSSNLMDEWPKSEPSEAKIEAHNSHHWWSSCHDKWLTSNHLPLASQIWSLEQIKSNPTFS